MEKTTMKRNKNDHKPKPRTRVHLKRPRNSSKKWRIEFIDTGKVVEFGQAGASDFTIHKDPKRMLQYLLRHAGIVPNGLKKLNGEELVQKALLVNKSRREKWGGSGYPSRAMETAGFWSRWLTWSLPDIKRAKRLIEDRFDIVFVV